MDSAFPQLVNPVNPSSELLTGTGTPLTSKADAHMA
jgi:hypothetical protein